MISSLSSKNQDQVAQCRFMEPSAKHRTLPTKDVSHTHLATLGDITNHLLQNDIIRDLLVMVSKVKRNEGLIAAIMFIAVFVVYIACEHR